MLLKMKPDEEYNKSIDDTKKALDDYALWCLGICGDEFPKITFKDMPHYADSDYMVFFDGKFNHFLEVKKRRNTKQHYQRTKVPLRKHSTAEHWWRAKEIKTYFLCMWTDQAGVFDLTEEPDEVKKMIARADRGDEEDVYALYDVSRCDKCEML